MGQVADILGRIADQRRQRIDALKLETPAWVLRERLGNAPPNGRLERALRRPGPDTPLRLVCEVKRASPSKGVLRGDVDPRATARAYAAGGATAISLVTEPDHFQGSLEWVNQVRGEVKLPILMKDFVVDSWQLVDAAARGADGILLIGALHSDVGLQRLIQEAVLLGLDALVEVHDVDELHRAVRAGASLVGINNRDLRTFEVNPQTALTLLPQVPPMVTAVAESGIAGPEDLAPLRATRCDAVLIGEALMTSPDPASTLAGLVAAAAG